MDLIYRAWFICKLCKAEFSFVKRNCHEFICLGNKLQFSFCTRRLTVETHPWRGLFSLSEPAYLFGRRSAITCHRMFTCENFPVVVYRGYFCSESMVKGDKHRSELLQSVRPSVPPGISTSIIVTDSNWLTVKLGVYVLPLDNTHRNSYCI
jgi:hypothetical protein